MGKLSVLVVDDEKNIRGLIQKALARLNVRIDTAMNGEEALDALDKQAYAVILLDLRMPGMDGMEVLRLIRDRDNPANVIIISAHGTIENAVEAMKLGAVDFLQKPFSPQEIRDLVQKSLTRYSTDGASEDDSADGYAHVIEKAKAAIESQDFEAAKERIQRAVAIDPERPEAFNMLGVVSEILGHKQDAQKYYRAAVSLDPTHEPSRKNLNRLTGLGQSGPREM